LVRSSAAEYLTFIAATGAQETAVEMRYEDENIWLTQKMMATLYDVDVRTINEHLKNIFADGELVEGEPVIRNFRIPATDGKNYLNAEELDYLERIVSLYLDFGELQAVRKIPMTMADWAKRLDGFLEFNGNEILTGPGKISHEAARLHAETEFEKHRIVQDRLFESDFDRLLKEAEPLRLEPARKPHKKKGDDA